MLLNAAYSLIMRNIQKMGIYKEFVYMEGKGRGEEENNSPKFIKLFPMKILGCKSLQIIFTNNEIMYFYCICICINLMKIVHIFVDITSPCQHNAEVIFKTYRILLLNN